MVIMDTSKKETNSHHKSKENTHEYGNVILTLTNCILPEEKLNPTPSFKDGLDPETEMDLRILGCELMQTAGILLRLPQVAMATAQVLFQRFYYSKSFVRQNFEVTGMGCLYLASKIEEAPRRIRDVINVYHHIKQMNCQRTLIPLVLDQNYVSLKYQVIKAERRVLKELGFGVHVKHPHKLIVLYLQVLGMENKQALMQTAWNYMNDSLRTDVFVRYQPETVACACIYLTARKLKVPLPRSPPWFGIFKVREDDIIDVCMKIIRLYKRSKPKIDELERKVQELCRKFEESRIRNKPGFNSVTSGNNTPNSPAPLEKKSSPKRRSHSSRSRSDSSTPRHKRYKRSRSKSYDKYKKSRSKRSRSKSPAYKSYKEKRYRSRSRSYERDSSYKNDKHFSDRYKEDRHYRDDRYRRDDDRYRREDEKYRKDDDKYRKDDDKYRKEDDSKYRKDEDKYKKDDELSKRKDSDKSRREDENIYRSKKEDTTKYKKEDEDDRSSKYKRNDENDRNSKYKREDDYDKYRRDDENDKYRKDDDYDKYRKDDDYDRYKKDDDYDKYRKDDDDEKYRKEDLRVRKEQEKPRKDIDGHKSKKDKSSVKDEEGKKLKTKHSSSKHKSSEKKKKKKHYEVVEEDDDDIEIIHVKKEKKIR